jgi:phosphoglycerate dehydrogenase-like enzyme
VFITPHCSGNSPRVKERRLALFFDNFNRYYQGKPLRNVVDKTAGY